MTKTSTKRKAISKHEIEVQKLRKVSQTKYHILYGKTIIGILAVLFVGFLLLAMKGDHEALRNGWIH